MPNFSIDSRKELSTFEYMKTIRDTFYMLEIYKQHGTCDMTHIGQHELGRTWSCTRSLEFHESANY